MATLFVSEYYSMSTRKDFLDILYYFISWMSSLPTGFGDSFFTLIWTSFITFDPEHPEGQLPSLWVSVCNTFWKTEDKRERDMDIFSKSLNKRRMYMQPYAHVVLFMYYVSPFLGSIHIYMKVRWLHRTSTTFLGAWGLSVLRVIKSVTDIFSFFCFWQQHWHFSCLYWRILVLYARHIE